MNFKWKVNAGWSLKERAKLQKSKGNEGAGCLRYKFLWPIPIDEINYNGALDPKTGQNPGY